jgi:hypothetical protein
MKISIILMKNLASTISSKRYPETHKAIMGTRSKYYIVGANSQG